MKAPAFELAQPGTLAEALRHRADDERYAVVLAGGQSLMPLLNLRLSSPEIVVDLNRVSELNFIAVEDRSIRVGSMTRQATVEDDPRVANLLPALPHFVRLIGHRTIRNRGTVGGSLCHADPSAELPALALALGATMVATSLHGSRRIDAADFNLGYLSTDLDPSELLTEVEWPLPNGWPCMGSAQFIRRSGDFALAAVMVHLDVSNDGHISSARVVAYGSLPRPTRLVDVERQLEAEGLGTSLRRVGEACRDIIRPSGDMHGSAEFKGHLFQVMCRRAVAEALEKLRAA